MKSRKLLLLFPVLILLGAFGIVQYYVWSNVFITEFHSDCTDTLLWAQASLESGSLFKPTFDYAYRLAFGGQWLFMPFLKIFGVGLPALRAGMCLFSVLFTLALVLFFRSLGHEWHISFMEAGIMLIAVCATKKTREIFYGHIIHYSLSVFYLLLAFIFLRLVTGGKKEGIRPVPVLLFTLVLFLCSANGSVEMLYVTLPILAACLIEWYLSRDKKLPAAAVCILLAACAGFLFSKSFNTNYSDSYNVIVPPEKWAENFLRFPMRWISLFYPVPGRNIDGFTPLWIKTVFKSITALLMLAGVCLSFSRYKKLPDPMERIFIFTVWMMFAALGYFFVFGKISDTDWRLTPLIFISEVLVLVLFFRVPFRDLEHTLSEGIAFLCGLMLLAHTISNGLTVARIGYDKKIWFAEDGLLETLKAHDLDYGYITSYWLSNSIAVLSDNTVRPRAVSFGEDGLYLNPFNSDLEWYNAQPGRDRYFLALLETEFDPLMPEALMASEIYDCVQEDSRNMHTDAYKILVLDHNIMQQEYEELLPRYK